MVEDSSAFEEIAKFVESVVVQAVGVDGHRAVLEHYIVACPCQPVESVVIEHLAVEQQRVALIHVDIAEGVEGVGGFVVEGAVAIHEHAFVAELDIAHQDLRIGVQPVVEEQAVGMQQVYLAVGRHPLPARLASRCHCHQQAETEEQGRPEDV